MLSISLDIPLGESEVQDENFVGSFVQANAEIIGLDISVDEVSVVDVLNTGDHLVDEHEHGLQRKLPECLVEERLQGRSHEIHDQDVVVP